MDGGMLSQDEINALLNGMDMSDNKTGEDSSAPSAPSVAAVNSTDAEITGVAEAGAVVTARLISGELLGSTVADQTDGDYIIAITPQTQGTVIKIVAKDAAGNVSPVTSVTVTA